MYDWDTMLTDFDVKESKRINDALAPRDNVLAYLRDRSSRSTIQKIGEAVNSPFWLGVYCGSIAGAFATVISAVIWGAML